MRQVQNKNADLKKREKKSPELHTQMHLHNVNPWEKQKT